MAHFGPGADVRLRAADGVNAEVFAPQAVTREPLPFFLPGHADL
jgi:hypothetical protein